MVHRATLADGTRLRCEQDIERPMEYVGIFPMTEGLVENVPVSLYGASRYYVNDEMVTRDVFQGVVESNRTELESQL